MAKSSPSRAKPPKARISDQSCSPADNRSLHGETYKTADLRRSTIEPDEAITGNQAVKISDDQISLKTGLRGPILIEHFYRRGKITHFDHEPSPSGPLRAAVKQLKSPAFSQDKRGDSVKGRKIALLGAAGAEAKQLKTVKNALAAHEALVERIASHAGTITDPSAKSQKINQAAPNAPSVVYDAVVIPGGDSAPDLAQSGLAIHVVNEAHRHGKPIAAIGNGSLQPEACALNETGAEHGVIFGDSPNAIEALIAALPQHRFPRRPIAAVPA